MSEQEQATEEPPKETVEPDFSSPEMQKARAFLRERYLRVITGIVGKPAEFTLYENVKLRGEFRGSDVLGLDYYVRYLETALGKVPEAVLRARDIVHFTVKDITPKKKERKNYVIML